MRGTGSPLGGSADLLDERGKARYGTPGPGEYPRVGSIGENFVYQNAPSYTFGFKPDVNKLVTTQPKQYIDGERYEDNTYSITNRREANPYISAQHSKAVGGADAPNPTYLPTYSQTEKAAPVVSFGTADRGAERARYISQYHCRENMGATTPGPGTYKQKHGKGIAKTLGDAPAYRFPRAQRSELGERELLYHPGPGAHQLPPTLGEHEDYKNPGVEWAPKYTFGPSRDGMACERVTVQLGADGPGAGEYEVGTTFASPEKRSKVDCAKLNQAAPGYSFSKVGRSVGDMQGKQPFISKEHMEPELCSPGPVYDTGANLGHQKRGVRFGEGERFYNPELGVSVAGPYISEMHSKTAAGANSPGPAHYTRKQGKGHRGTLGDSQQTKFGTAVRKTGEGPINHDWVPGPGAYQLPRNAAELTGEGGKKAYTAGPTYSVASCLRTDFTKGEPDDPGPGHYEIDKGISQLDIRKSKPPMAKFGKDKNRHSFMSVKDSTPGPGQYSPGGSKKGPKYSFAPADPEEGRRLTQSMKDHRSNKHTPGPNAYSLPSGKGHARTLGDASTTKFGTAARGNSKMYLGPEHVKVDALLANESPGPGAYQPQGISGFSNRYKNSGGCSFGTSTRPPLATVKF